MSCESDIDWKFAGTEAAVLKTWIRCNIGLRAPIRIRQGRARINDIVRRVVCDVERKKCVRNS